MDWNISYGLTIALGLPVLAVFLIRKFRENLFASFCANMAKGKVLHGEKEKLFERLNVEAEKAIPRKLKVLEIGGGSGTNFAFVKVPVEWTVTEPNHCFKSHFLKSCAPHKEKHDIGNLVHAHGEDLRKFESESIDAVISTLVLCSVSGMEVALKEIRRVLKPGGTFYFLEHIRSPESTKKVSWIHYLICKSSIWPDPRRGCHKNLDIKSAIMKAGFSKVEMVDFTTEFKSLLFLYQNPIPHAFYGWAHK